MNARSWLSSGIVVLLHLSACHDGADHEDASSPSVDLAASDAVHAPDLARAEDLATEDASPDGGGFDLGLAAGVHDWRDAISYHVIIDRFLDGDPTNNCNVMGTQSTPYTTTNYAGGDWAGLTQQIQSGYFTDLGVNTLWVTVPFRNADDVADTGQNGDSHVYSSYEGHWPKDFTTTESCFGSAADLTALVAAAHTAGMKLLFDYAPLDIHTESAVYQQHQSDSPSWFTPECICGTQGCGDFDTSCWLAPYLAHFDYTNPLPLAYTIDAATSTVEVDGNDGFRIDAVTQLGGSWLPALRTSISSQVLAMQSPRQRFYLVGDTEEFQDRALIKSYLDASTMLDGQLDYPLRIRIVEALLMRSTQNNLTPDDPSFGRTAPPGMTGLAQFMDSNDAFYPSNSVMATFIGNPQLPRSIHYAEQTLPSWISDDDPSIPSAADGKNAAWTNEPALETDPDTYERLANAFAVILTNKGNPVIYYGDEYGLPGAGDPDNRRMMQWSGYSTAQQALRDRVKALAAIRAVHPALRRGVRTTLEVGADLWVYSLATVSGDPTTETVYVAINRSDSDLTTTSVPSGLTELLTYATSASTETIPARQTRIFR